MVPPVRRLPERPEGRVLADQVCATPRTAPATAKLAALLQIAGAVQPSGKNADEPRTGRRTPNRLDNGTAAACSRFCGDISGPATQTWR
jgi:hypothetical protein